MKHLLVIAIVILIGCSSGNEHDAGSTEIDYVTRGNSFTDSGDFDKAIKEFNRAIEDNPDNARAYAQRASAWRWLGELDKALDDCNQAATLDPTLPSAYNFRGLVFASKGKYEQAVTDYNEAIDLDPSNPRTFHDRGAAWHFMGERFKAIDDYTEAIRLDPHLWFVYQDRGATWQAMGEFDKALSDFTEAINLNPSAAISHYHVSALLAFRPDEENPDFPKALEFATKACELTAWSESAPLLTLAEVCGATGDFESAVKWQTKAVEVSQSESERRRMTERLDSFKSGQL